MTRPLLVADLFCGAGGSSQGAKRAVSALGRRMTLTCVNHWDRAIETHSRMHPEARHYCQDVASVRPLQVVPEGRLDLLMASPTCTYHSRARGGRPTSDQQRMDPWHIVTWLSELRVQRLIIENVPEFVKWGPVNARTGRPVKSREGEYFSAWQEAMGRLGMRGEHRLLNCADYITHHGGGNRARDVEAPLPTLTTANRGELALITGAFGERPGQAPRVRSVDEPAPTICAGGYLPLVEPVSDGQQYDILFRMLDPRELARAMSFSDDDFTYEFAGTKTEITRQIGNAVPVRTAQALVGAAFHDLASVELLAAE